MTLEEKVANLAKVPDATMDSHERNRQRLELARSEAGVPTDGNFAGLVIGIACGVFVGGWDSKPPKPPAFFLFRT